MKVIPFPGLETSSHPGPGPCAGEASSPSPRAFFDIDVALAVEMAADILENPLAYQPGQVEAAAETMLAYRKGAEPDHHRTLRRIACMWLTNRSMT